MNEVLEYEALKAERDALIHAELRETKVKLALGCRQKPTFSAKELGNEYAVRVSRLTVCTTKAN